MYIVNEQDFKQQYVKPQNGAELYTDVNNNTLDMWIDEYARLLLQNALGNVLFPLFDADVTDGELDDDAEQRWKDLVKGVTYTYEGKTKTWQGLKYTQGKATKSLLIDYVESEWLTFKASHVSNFGDTVGQSVNSVITSMNTRQYKAWNSFVRAYQGNHKYNKDCYSYWRNFSNSGYYNDFLLGRYLTNKVDTGYVSLVDFLKQNEADYPDPALTLYGLKNAFSI